MNRTIKFRVWDKIEKRWFNEEITSCIHYGFWNLNEDLFCLYEMGDFILSQNIGLKDKNNKDIYEGDIINFETYGIPHGPERDYIKNAEVYYDKKLVSFCFGLFNNGEYEYTYQMIDRIDEKTIEIIGNIFENLELLNNKKNNE